MDIVIVGLGTRGGDLSLDGDGVIRGAARRGARVVFKTGRYSGVERYADIEYECMDALYDECKDFEQLNKRLATTIIEYGRQGGVVYCVPGNAYSDGSVALIRKKCASAVVYPSFDWSGVALGYAPTDDYTVVSAYKLIEKRTLDTTNAVVVVELDNRELAGAVKLRLGDFYSLEQQAWFVREGKRKRIRLYELDRQKGYDHTATVLIEGTEVLKKTKLSFDDLTVIMDALMSQKGCPWDRAQTHQSIRTNLIEEAYEAVEAIDCEDNENLIEELGDVLLQSVFHSAIAKREEEFDLGEVLDSLCKKLIYRHPHVFGQKVAADASSALDSWEQAKSQQKDPSTLASELNAIPAAFPQTLRAVKIGKKSSKAGIGTDVDVELCAQNINELMRSLTNDGDAEQELGNALFAICTAARLKGVDPELALKKACDQKVKIVQRIEQLALDEGKSIAQLSEDELTAMLVRIFYED